MKVTKSVLNRLQAKHPHSADLVAAFAPLLEVQMALAEEFPGEPLKVDEYLFVQGKPLVLAKDMPLPDDLLHKSVKKMSAAIAKHFPELSEHAKALGKHLSKDLEAAKELIRLRLAGKMTGISRWAKKHEMNKDTAALMAVQLASTFGRAVAKAVNKESLPAWLHGHCPVCGSRPHASILREKEGKRSLQCSLCGHEWAFSRTTCPVCDQAEVNKFSVFHIDDAPEERAVACEVCNHYILEVDLRKLIDDTPIELYVLCMIPLDMLLHEKEFIAAVETKK